MYITAPNLTPAAVKSINGRENTARFLIMSALQNPVEIMESVTQPVSRSIFSCIGISVRAMQVPRRCPDWWQGYAGTLTGPVVYHLVQTCDPRLFIAKHAIFDVSTTIHAVIIISDPSLPCTCDKGWIGDQCETRKEACTSYPCKNGATCINTDTFEWATYPDR